MLLYLAFVNLLGFRFAAGSWLPQADGDGRVLWQSLLKQQTPDTEPSIERYFHLAMDNRWVGFEYYVSYPYKLILPDKYSPK